MDIKKRKELVEEYKNRQLEMGVICLTCKSSGESFLDVCKDTKVGFNSARAKLGMNSHPNKQLQQLWDKYGAEDFDFSVIRVLEYDNVNDNHDDELELLRDECLNEIPNSSKVWR